MSQLSTGPWRERDPCYYLRGRCTESGCTRVAAGSEKIHRLLDQRPNSDLILPARMAFGLDTTAIIFDITSPRRASILEGKATLRPREGGSSAHIPSCQRSRLCCKCLSCCIADGRRVDPFAENFAKHISAHGLTPATCNTYHGVPCHSPFPLPVHPRLNVSSARRKT